jgi:hypothetical protein
MSDEATMTRIDDILDRNPPEDWSYELLGGPRAPVTPDMVDRLQADLAELKIALEFYADESRYDLQAGNWVTVWEDKGFEARRALKVLA